MTDRIIYTLDVPEDTVLQSQSQVQRNVAALGAIGAGQSTVENISLEPNQQLLAGRFAGKYAELSAAEVEGLFDAPGYDAVPVFGASASTPQDAYYSLEDVDAGPPAPSGTTRFQRFDGALRKVGTVGSHWRATKTSPSGAQNNDFGNDTTAYVGVPAAARKVKWYNSETGAREDPTLVETRNAEYGDVEIYDADASSYSNPTAIFELDYQDDPDVDCKLWSDRGAGLGNKFDSDGYRQWQRVWRPSYRFESGSLAIVDTGLLRLIFDEGNQSMQAQQWDDANTTWSSVSLGSSDWQLFDLDIRRITAAVVEARVEFEDTTQSPTAYYTLTMLAHRGYKTAQWFFPDGKGPTPSKLVTKLDPVANESVVDPQPEKSLVARDEVQA